MQSLSPRERRHECLNVTVAFDGCEDGEHNLGSVAIIVDCDIDESEKRISQYSHKRVLKILDNHLFLSGVGKKHV